MSIPQFLKNKKTSFLLKANKKNFSGMQFNIPLKRKSFPVDPKIVLDLSHFA